MSKQSGARNVFVDARNVLLERQVLDLTARLDRIRRAYKEYIKNQDAFDALSKAILE